MKHLHLSKLKPMKKIALSLLAGLVIACGGSTEKKEDGFKFNRTKKEETKAVKEIFAISTPSNHSFKIVWGKKNAKKRI